MNTTQTFYLTKELVLRYLIYEDEALEKMITLEQSEVALVTTDEDLYHALGSLRAYDNFKMNKLTKFIEQVTITSKNAKKTRLTDELVEAIRQKALQKVGGQ